MTWIRGQHAPLGREYIATLTRHWWSLVVGVVGGVSWLADAIAHSFGWVLVYPRWVSVAVCFAALSVAQFLAFADMRKQRDNALASASSVPIGPDPNEWDVEFRRGLIDVKVYDKIESRYGIAVDVVITNRSDKPLSLSAELHAQWAHPMMFNVAAVSEQPLPAWRDIVAAFGLPDKKQLVFPLRVERGAESGHLVFPIEIVGMGVRSAGEFQMGGVDEEEECERDREYRLVIKDRLTAEKKSLSVERAVAPLLDGSGRVRKSDLAVAGRADTLILHATRDDAALHESNTHLQNAFSRLADDNVLLRNQVEMLRREAPRHLSDYQRRVIAEKVSLFMKPFVDNGRQIAIGVYSEPCTDCASYANEFKDLLRSAGVTVLRGGRRHWSPDGGGPVEEYRRGVYIRYDPIYEQQHSVPSLATVLYEALAESGIPAKLLDRPGFGWCDLIISEREV